MRKLVKCLAPILWLTTFASFGKSAAAFIVGAQDINYFPHYSFKEPNDKGYAWAVLDEFAKQEGLDFIYVALPIKRLQKELIKGTVDFAYPDNPKWQSSEINTKTKAFSTPITKAMGGTMVLPVNLGRGIEYFQLLGVPLGFTPIMWDQWISRGSVKVVSVKDADAALQMVKRGRVDGADIEYHVARHLLRLAGNERALVLDPSLPYDIVDFQLSTIRHAAILKKLDLFLNSNQARLEVLKARYNLVAPAQILSTKNAQIEQSKKVN